MDKLYGMPVVETAQMVDHHSRILTWRERLFSWPWRPWVKWIFWTTPSQTMYLIRPDKMFGRGSETVVAHPSMVDQLRGIGGPVNG